MADHDVEDLLDGGAFLQGRRERARLLALAREAVAEAPEVDARLLGAQADAEVLVDPSRVRLALQAMLRYALPRARGPIEVEARVSPEGASLAVALRGEVTGRAAEAAFHLAVPGESLALARRIAIQHGGSLAFERRGCAWLVLTLPLPGSEDARAGGPRGRARGARRAPRAGLPRTGRGIAPEAGVSVRAPVPSS